MSFFQQIKKKEKIDHLYAPRSSSQLNVAHTLSLSFLFSSFGGVAKKISPYKRPKPKPPPLPPADMVNAPTRFMCGTGDKLRTEITLLLLLLFFLLSYFNMILFFNDFYQLRK